MSSHRCTVSASGGASAGAPPPVVPSTAQQARAFVRLVADAARPAADRSGRRPLHAGQAGPADARSTCRATRRALGRPVRHLPRARGQARRRHAPRPRCRPPGSVRRVRRPRAVRVDQVARRRRHPRRADASLPGDLRSFTKAVVVGAGAAPGQARRVDPRRDHPQVPFTFLFLGLGLVGDDSRRCSVPSAACSARSAARAAQGPRSRRAGAGEVTCAAPPLPDLLAAAAGLARSPRCPPAPTRRTRRARRTPLHLRRPSADLSVTWHGDDQDWGSPGALVSSASTSTSASSRRPPGPALSIRSPAGDPRHRPQGGPYVKEVTPPTRSLGVREARTVAAEAFLGASQRFGGRSYTLISDRVACRVCAVDAGHNVVWQYGTN